MLVCMLLFMLVCMLFCMLFCMPLCLPTVIHYYMMILFRLPFIMNRFTLLRIYLLVRMLAVVCMLACRSSECSVVWRSAGFSRSVLRTATPIDPLGSHPLGSAPSARPPRLPSARQPPRIRTLARSDPRDLLLGCAGRRRLTTFALVLSTLATYGYQSPMALDNIWASPAASLVLARSGPRPLWSMAASLLGCLPLGLVPLDQAPGSDIFQSALGCSVLGCPSTQLRWPLYVLILILTDARLRRSAAPALGLAHLSRLDSPALVLNPDAQSPMSVGALR